MAKDKTSEPVFKGSELILAAVGIQRDVMSAVLRPEDRYTEAQAEALVSKFLSKEVTKNGGR